MISGNENIVLSLKIRLLENTSLQVVEKSVLKHLYYLEPIHIIPERYNIIYCKSPYLGRPGKIIKLNKLHRRFILYAYVLLCWN